MFFVKKGWKQKTLGEILKKNRPTSGGYYDPPFKCRVPTWDFTGSYPYSLKGLGGATKSQQNANIFTEKTCF